MRPTTRFSLCPIVSGRQAALLLDGFPGLRRDKTLSCVPGLSRGGCRYGAAAAENFPQPRQMVRRYGPISGSPSDDLRAVNAESAGKPGGRKARVVHRRAEIGWVHVALFLMESRLSKDGFIFKMGPKATPRSVSDG
jgi:hypothetical protein